MKSPTGGESVNESMFGSRTSDFKAMSLHLPFSRLKCCSLPVSCASRVQSATGTSNHMAAATAHQGSKWVFPGLLSSACA